MLKVTDNSNGQRLDNYLIKNFKGVPKSLWYRLLRKGAIYVNERRQKKPDYRVQTDDQIRVPDIQVAESTPTQVPLKVAADFKNYITHEDNDCLLINKPAGMAVHGGSNLRFGIIDILRQHSQHSYLELVHRLDKDTSGCLLIAKQRSFLVELHNMLREHRVQKRYLAVVAGRFPRKITTITAPLLEVTLGNERMVVESVKGKAATTKVQVLAAQEHASLLALQPISGRKHQLRVHLQSVGYPIIGDKKYGSKFSTAKLTHKTLFLHCESLKFNLKGARMYQCALPESFAQDLVTLGLKSHL